MRNFGKSRLRKGISIVASVVLLLSTVVPTVPVFAQELCTNGEQAYIGTTCHSTLGDAIAAAGDSDVITLIQDINLDGYVEIRKPITIDMNNHSIVSSNSYLLDVYDDLTLQGSGVVESTYDNEPDKGTAIWINGNEKTLTVGENVVLRGNNGLVVGNDLSNHKYTVNFGGTIEGRAIGISINGNITEKNNSPTINILSTANIGVSGGTPIYLAGYGNTTIANGVTVNGTDSAVEIRAGELTINGGTYTATASSYSCNANGNGTTTVGAALAVAQHTTSKDVKVTVNAGTFNGRRAFNFANPENNTDPSPQIVVNGGTFNGTESAVEVADDYNGVITKFIQGGTFSTEVDENLIADGYGVIQGAGVWTVNKYVAQIVGGTSYTSLEAALDGAQNGDTIKLLSNIELDELVESYGINIDLNGNVVEGSNNGIFDCYGNVTITDSSDGKTGKIIGNWGVWANPGADVTIDGVSIEATRYGVASNTGTVLVKDSSISSAQYGVTADGNSNITIDNSTISSDGGWGVAVFNTTRLTVQNNTSISALEEGGIGISANGNAENSATIIISDGTIRGGDLGIYQPSGTVTINGGTIEGATAIYQKAGTLTINGNPTITANGEARDFEHNGNGANPTADAIVLEGCDYPGGFPTANINGGTITSTNNNQVGYYIYENNAAPVVNANTDLLTLTDGYEWVAGGDLGYSVTAKLYTVAVNGGTANPTEQSKGKTVTITANDPEAGQVFDKWTVTAGGVTLADANSAETTFTMGTADVVVAASYKAAPTHGVTVTNGTADPTEQSEGLIVTITAIVPSGKVFNGWTVTAGGVTLVDANSAETTFTMGTADVVVAAELVDEPQPVEELVVPASLTTIQTGSTSAQISLNNAEVQTGDVTAAQMATTTPQIIIQQQTDNAALNAAGETEGGLESKLTEDFVVDTGMVAEMQGILNVKLIYLNGLGGSEVLNNTSPVNFSSPVKLLIPVSSVGPVKVRVKHGGDSEYGLTGLTLNSGATCFGGLVTSEGDAYTGGDVPVIGGKAIIYTCSASSFVAYTETTPAPASTSKSTSLGGGGGTTPYSCKNLPANAVANNKTTPKKNTDYSYSTDTGAVCTFQCKSGYTRNEEASKCEKADGTEVDTEKVDSDTTDVDSDTSDTTSTEDLKKVLDDGYTVEFHNAYDFAFKHGITTMPSIEAAHMNSPLTRIAMAKMLSQYAINVLGKKPANVVVPEFPDVTADMDAQYDNGVTLAYQLGIMGINVQNFRPNDLVTRAEFGTALSRLLFGTPDGEGAYYETHLKKLMEEGIITNDNPNMQEVRGYVMIMLMRSASK